MTVPALVLAAGLGSRYAAAGGVGPKVLATLAGRPLLTHAVDRALGSGCPSVTVVVHPDLAGTSAVTSLGDAPDDPGTDRATRTVHVVVNPHPADGIGASLAVGLRALAARDDTAEACVVLLADQPGVGTAVVTAVVDAWRQSGRPARARYRDGESHPVVLPRVIWPELLEAHGGAAHGARGLLAALDVVGVTVDADAPRDVDLPADLAAALTTDPTTGGHGTAGHP